MDYLVFKQYDEDGKLISPEWAFRSAYNQPSRRHSYAKTDEVNLSKLANMGQRNNVKDFYCLTGYVSRPNRGKVTDLLLDLFLLLYTFENGMIIDATWLGEEGYMQVNKIRDVELSDLPSMTRFSNKLSVTQMNNLTEFIKHYKAEDPQAFKVAAMKLYELIQLNENKSSGKSRNDLFSLLVDRTWPPAA